MMTIGLIVSFIITFTLLPTLINFIPGKGTQVTYIWNGELLGKFPKSRLKDAWLEQGTEVLTWLYEYLRKNRVKQF